jgi:hypothetical protein
MEFQLTLNRQNSIERENQIWRAHTSSFQNLLQDYSIQTMWFGIRIQI